jgi:hypothetical protein
VIAVIVLLLLGVIWAAVLIPPWVQSRRETRPIASMRSFHRQLWLLERTSPGNASRPRGRVASSAVTVYGGPDDYDAGYGYGYGVDAGHGYDRFDDDEYDYDGYEGDDPEFDELDGYEGYEGDGADVPGLAGAGALGAGAGAGAGALAAGSAGVPSAQWASDDRWAELAEARRRRLAAERSPAAARRRLQGYRRRRRVLATLLLAAIATAPLAALVGGVGWWVAHAVADTLLVGYVALLVQRQRRSIEREEKVHYLAPIRAPRPAVVVLHGGATP